MPKTTPPPSVSLETLQTVLAATADFAAFAPWEFAYDTDIVGLIDPVTGEVRIGCVLGNAGEVFGIVIYRRAGIRWILSMLEGGSEDFEGLDAMEGMDCLKIEFVPKRELAKEDLAVLKVAAFKPSGKGAVWPQFRSVEPGWHPWYISQAEAEQLIADLPRLTAFYKMLEEHPGLFDDRAPTEVPFLPLAMPQRALSPQDIDWRPVLLSPEAALEPFQPAGGVLDELRALKRLPGCVCEFDCAILPGGSFIENGRPCFGRCCMLVETRRGLVVGVSMLSGALPVGEAAGRGLIECLRTANVLPEEIVIGGSRFQSALQPLCDALQIRLTPASSLPALDEAVASLSQHMSGRGV